MTTYKTTIEVKKAYNKRNKRYEYDRIEVTDEGERIYIGTYQTYDEALSTYNEENSLTPPVLGESFPSY